MFDTLDTIIGFVVIIFILSIIAQSAQALLKRFLNPKTSIVVNKIKEILDKITPEEAAKMEILKGEFNVVKNALKKKYKFSEFTVDNLKAVADEVGKAGPAGKASFGAADIENIKSKITAGLESESKNLQERYTHYMGQMSVAIALIISVGLNADSLQMMEKIGSDKAVRQALVQSDYLTKLSAEKKADKPAGAASSKEETERLKKNIAGVSDLMKEYQGLNIGVKWSKTGEDFMKTSGWTTVFFILQKLVGLMITATLVSMGAPFWHDTLESLTGLKNKLRENMPSR